MKDLVVICLALYLLQSCTTKQEGNQTVINTEPLLNEIKNLKTVEAKNDFLYELWHEDQNLRKDQEDKVIAQYGYDSEEHKQFIKAFIIKNEVIFKKLKAYLEIHAYPKEPEKYHELSLNAFPIIIGHYHKFEDQKALLPFLYEAYKANQCPLDNVVWVLGEMHEAKHKGQRYKMSTNRYTTEQEFKELVATLQLDLEL